MKHSQLLPVSYLLPVQDPERGEGHPQSTVLPKPYRSPHNMVGAEVGQRSLGVTQPACRAHRACWGECTWRFWEGTKILWIYASIQTRLGGIFFPLSVSGSVTQGCAMYVDALAFPVFRQQVPALSSKHHVEACVYEVLICIQSENMFVKHQPDAIWSSWNIKMHKKRIYNRNAGRPLIIAMLVGTYIIQIKSLSPSLHF